jgi:hypothetical protein
MNTQASATLDNQVELLWIGRDRLSSVACRSVERVRG